MSWQSYVDELVGSGQVAKAAIIGSEHGIIWVTKPASLWAGEVSVLLTLFNQPDRAFDRGLKVGGDEYTCVKANSQSIYGQKGPTGVVCAKTHQTIIVATYGETQQPDNAATAVENLAEFLRVASY